MSSALSLAPSPRSLIPRLALLALLVFALLCSLGILRPHKAHAFPFAEWCFDDPLVSINGIALDTEIGAYGDPHDVRPHMTVARFVYILPSNVTASVISSTNTYMREQVAFSFTGPAVQPGRPIPVSVSVTFKASRTFQAQMLNSENGAMLSTVSGDTAGGMTATFTLR